jgi:hypothetical protein
MYDPPYVHGVRILQGGALVRQAAMRVPAAVPRRRRREPDRVY